MLKFLKKKAKIIVPANDALPCDIDFAGVTYKKGTSLRALIAKAEMFKSLGFSKQGEIDQFRRDIQSFRNSDGHSHLEWIYERMLSVHKESPNTDYMLKFRSILNTVNFYL